MNKTFIIAEAGVNHNGSVARAKELIDVAAQCGADAVKFQTFKTENVISKFAQKAEYQKKTTGAQESQFEMVKKLELRPEDFIELARYAQTKNIEFMSTPFDHGSVDLLVREIKVKRLKVPSGEVTNGPLLLKVARSGCPVIMSTGMSNLSEVKIALGVLAFGYTENDKPPGLGVFEEALRSEAGQKILKEKVTILHCTSEYPAPYNEVNLRAMDTLAETYNLPVGYSDHTQGVMIPVAAVARGAVVIEKHFTLDKNLPGPDHKASLDPAELGLMVTMIRAVEKALGDGKKEASPTEEQNKSVVRRSLVAFRAISQGEVFSEENLTAKRPGLGLSPLLYWDWLGKKADRDYREDEEIR